MHIVPYLRLILIGVVIFSMPFLSTCGQLDETPSQHIAKAYSYMDKGELRAAYIELSNALRKDPKAMEARWLLGKVSVEQGDGAKAEKELTRAVELGLDRSSTQPMIARAILMQGEFDRLLSETEELASGMEKSNLALILSLRGYAYLEKSELEKAKETLEKALKMDSNSIEAMIGHASYYGIQRNYDEARVWAQRALDVDPASREAWSTLGGIELAAENNESSEKAIGKAIALQKYPSLDRAKRVMVRTQLGKLEEAEEDIQVLRQQQFKDHPYVNYAVGVYYFKKKQYPEALEAFEASYRILPSSISTEIYLATTNMLLGNMEQARVLADRVHSRTPQLLEAGQLAAAARLSSADYHSAKNVLLESLNNHPDDQLTLSMLATLELNQGNIKKSIEYIEKLTELKPDSQQVKEMLNVARLLDGQSLAEVEDDQADMLASDETFNQDLLYAVEALRDKKYKQAIARAQEISKKYPDRTQPLTLISTCYIALGERGKAKGALQKILRISPTEASASRNLAMLEAQDGNFELARRLLKPVVDEFPGDEGGALLLANIETRLGNGEEAMRVLELVVENNPKALSARSKLAEEYFSKGKISEVLHLTRDLSDEQSAKKIRLLELRGKAQMLSSNIVSASRTFEILVELAPNSAKARHFFADSLSRGGDIKLAREEIERAVQIDPQYFPARLSQVKILAESGEKEQALKKLSELKQDFGGRAEVWGVAGWLALLNGDYATAEKELIKAREEVADTPLTLYLVSALWVQQKSDQALKVMQDWLKQYPRDLAVLLKLAGAQLSLGREDDARATYARVVEHYPNHVPALNNLAWLNRETDMEKALAYVGRAHALAPNDPQVLDTSGVLMLESGDAQTAYNRLRAAAERAPDDPAIQLHLGRALLMLERFAEAQEVLNALIDTTSESQIVSDAKTLLQTMPGQ